MSRPNASQAAAIWDESRVRAFVAAHPHGADVGEIAAYLGISASAVGQVCCSALRWASMAAVLDAWRERTETT